MKCISGDRPDRRQATSNENRCVWMEAGIVSYLLCEREFDCDRCPLDEAMRSHISVAGKTAARFEPAASTNSPGRVDLPGSAAAPGDTDAGPCRAGSRSYYTIDHLEVRLSGEGTARFGIEPGLAGLLPPVKSAVLPGAGESITPGSFSGWLIVEGGTLPLRLPVGGTITAVNPLLADEPHRIRGGCADDGWLLEFTPDDPGAFDGAFLKPDEAAARYVADLDTFRRVAIECLHPEGARAAHTLPDGGRFVADLSTMIGPFKYLQIIRRVFRENH